MSNIVLFTPGITSDLNAVLGLGRRLRAVGHNLVYVSPVDLGDRVRAEGHRFIRIDHDKRLLGELPRVDAERSFVACMQKRRELRRQSLRLSELEDLLTELKPDLLLVNPEMHYVIIATAALRIPTLLIMVWFCFLPRRGLPALDTDVMPQPGLIGELKTTATLLKPPFANRWQRIRRLFTKAGFGTPFRVVSYQTRDYADLKALAKARGYDLAKRATQNVWLTPLAYRELPLLSVNALEMEFPHHPHPQVHYLGPMVQLDRQEPRLSAAESGALEAFLASTSEQKKPLIYCSLGSYWGPDLTFLGKVIDVFQRRPQWHLIIGLGAKRSADSLGSLPDNVLVLAWAPQTRILKAASCAITHAGISTVNECVACEVPMLAYSSKHVDQNGTAARIQYHGLGIKADKAKDDSAEIERKLERVLGDPEIREHLKAMRLVFEEYERCNRAVQIVESYLPGSKPL